MYKILLPLLMLSSLYADAPKHIFEIGAKTTAFNYTERDFNDQKLNTEESNFFEIGGVYASYSYKLKETNYPDANVAHYINFYGSYTGGNTDYTGSKLVGTNNFGSINNTTVNSFYEVEVNIKQVKYYDISSRYVLFGLGYKEWERELSSSQLETYHYRYIQIAIGGEKQIYKNWSLGLDLTVQLGFDQEMDADFAETSQTNTLNETFKLGTVYTYKIATPLVIPINKQLSFTTKLEYEFTNYNKSNTIIVNNFFKSAVPSSNLHEPASKQKNWHMYAGLQYIF